MGPNKGPDGEQISWPEIYQRVAGFDNGQPGLRRQGTLEAVSVEDKYPNN